MSPPTVPAQAAATAMVPDVLPMPAPALELTAYDHVGIRISRTDRALRFYSLFGFRVVAESPQSKSRAVEIENAQGVRIHLICNGNEQAQARNILQDNDWGFPGVTHAAFLVADLQAAADTLRGAGIEITEGPKLDQRRTYLFCRDPDGNVIELNQLL